MRQIGWIMDSCRMILFLIVVLVVLIVSMQWVIPTNCYLLWATTRLVRSQGYLHRMFCNIVQCSHTCNN